jgi:hypothetical protein
LKKHSVTLIMIGLFAISLTLTGCGTVLNIEPTPSVTGVQGKVTYADSNEPISGVTIYLNDPQSGGEKNPDLTTAQTTTDAEGNYSFMDIAPGRYMISFVLFTKTGVSSIEFTANVSDFLTSFEGVSQDGTTTLNMVEPEIDVLSGEVFQEDFIVHP